MNCKNLVFLSIMFIAAPMWIGYIWVRLLRLENRAEQLLQAWVLGFATMLGTAQLVLVPLVALGQSLTTAIWVWKLVLQLLGLFSFFFYLQKLLKEQTDGTSEEKQPKRTKKYSAWSVCFGVLALVMILVQAYIPAKYEHSDDDDSRFISEEVSAVTHDTMYKESTVGADFLYWNEGEVRKDFTSPWAMFVAMIAKSSGIAPAVLSHAYLPFYLTLLCYALYLLIGKNLFQGDWEKTFVFLIFLSVLHLAGYTSTHTLASMLLLRIWQGKAVCASFMLPLLFYLFYQIMQKEYKRGWIALLYVATTGSCLLSGIGIVTAPIVVLLYGLVDFCCCRKWRKTLAIWMSALPCAIYFGYYLM
jgi:hypothetical protein